MRRRDDVQKSYIVFVAAFHELKLIWLTMDGRRPKRAANDERFILRAFGNDVACSQDESALADGKTCADFGRHAPVRLHASGANEHHPRRFAGVDGWPIVVGLLAGGGTGQRERRNRNPAAKTSVVSTGGAGKFPSGADGPEYLS
jgi:hypothetical protein